MKARVPWNPTAKQRKIMKAEINRQILKTNEQFNLDFDAMILYQLHVQLGFGKKRLRRFWDGFKVAHKELVEFYEMPNDGAYLCRKMLERIGVDVEEWTKED